MQINKQAQDLNDILRESNPCLVEMLSKKGLRAFFPAKGILSQTADGKGKTYNATIGAATEENGSVMCLKSLRAKVYTDPQKCFPYASSYGRQELRELWQGMIREKNPSIGNTEISLPVVTCALTHGLSIAGFLFANENDEVITPDLFWGNYKLIFEGCHNASIKTFQCFNGKGFNTEGLREMLLSEGGKKILILNFPNNPSGYTPTEQEVDAIESAVLEAAQMGKNIITIIDDAYFGLVYEEGIYKESIFARLADLHERVLAIKVDGATKEDYVWGFRVGFLTYAYKGMSEKAAKALEAKTAGAIRGNISNSPNISQSLLCETYSSDTYKAEKIEKFRTLKLRYEKVKKVLQEHPEYSKAFEPLPFNSGYFMCIKLKDLDAEMVRQILLEKYDTGIIAIQDKIRIAFSSLPTSKIEQLFKNIYLATEDAKNQ